MQEKREKKRKIIERKKEREKKEFS